VFAIVGLLFAVGVGVVYAGALVESRWTGSLAPCSRVKDNDNSTFQTGRASMRWLPPMVHCRFDHTPNDSPNARELPSADKDQFAPAGVALAGIVALCLSLFAGLVVAGTRLASRRQRFRT
jgi:hypothetical protein